MSENLTAATHSQSLLPGVLKLLNDCRLLNECDTRDQKLIAEYNHFMPAKCMEFLLERFSCGEEVQSLTTFIDDMKALISDDEKRRCNKYSVHYKSEEVEALEKKYSLGFGIDDMITYSRLRFLFPNLIDLSSDGLYGENKFIPQMFGAPEFGGLIPIKYDKYNFYGKWYSCKEEVIAVHLYCLRLIEPKIPLRLHHLLLKKRIDEGLLSDKKRKRFLIAQGIIKPDGTMTAKFTEVYRTMCELSPKFNAEIKEVEEINGFSLVSVKRTQSAGTK